MESGERKNKTRKVRTNWAVVAAIDQSGNGCVRRQNQPSETESTKQGRGMECIGRHLASIRLDSIWFVSTSGARIAYCTHLFDWPGSYKHQHVNT